MQPSTVAREVVDEGRGPGSAQPLERARRALPADREEVWQGVAAPWREVRNLDSESAFLRCESWIEFYADLSGPRQQIDDRLLAAVLRRGRELVESPVEEFHCDNHITRVVAVLATWGGTGDLGPAVEAAYRGRDRFGKPGSVLDPAWIFGSAAANLDVRDLVDRSERLRALVARHGAGELEQFEMHRVQSTIRLAEDLEDDPTWYRYACREDEVAVDWFNPLDLRRWAEPHLASPSPRRRARALAVLASGAPGSSDISRKTVARAWSDFEAGRPGATPARLAVAGTAARYLTQQLPDTRDVVLSALVDRLRVLSPRDALQLMNGIWMLWALPTEVSPTIARQMANALEALAHRSRGLPRAEIERLRDDALEIVRATG